MFALLNLYYALVFVVTVTTMTSQPVAIMCSGSVLGAPAPMTAIALVVPELAGRNRDKTGTSTNPKNTSDSQIAKNKPNASRGSFSAEGKGFEPSTGFPALDFESSR